ncbi:hypothetical protein, partial [Actinophytocola sediminis]
GGPLGGVPGGGESGGPGAVDPVAGEGAPVSPQRADRDAAREKDPRTVASTEGTESWLSRWAFPLLVAFGLLAAVAAGAVQVASRPDHPVRRAIRAVVRR